MTPTNPGTWPINEILYGVQFDPLNERTVDGVAQAMVDHRYLVSGPAAYLAAIEQALRSDAVLTDALRTRHSEESFRAFLEKLRDRLLALKPWPEPRFRKLPVSEWESFGEAKAIARIPDLHPSTVAERLPSIFDDVRIGESSLPVLVLRLGTGETVCPHGIDRSQSARGGAAAARSRRSGRGDRAFPRTGRLFARGGCPAERVTVRDRWRQAEFLGVPLRHVPFVAGYLWEQSARLCTPATTSRSRPAGQRDLRSGPPASTFRIA